MLHTRRFSRIVCRYSFNWESFIDAWHEKDTAITRVKKLIESSFSSMMWIFFISLVSDSNFSLTLEQARILYSSFFQFETGLLPNLCWLPWRSSYNQLRALHRMLWISERLIRQKRFSNNASPLSGAKTHIYSEYVFFSMNSSEIHIIRCMATR